MPVESRANPIGSQDGALGAHSLYARITNAAMAAIMKMTPSNGMFLFSVGGKRESRTPWCNPPHAFQAWSLAVVNHFPWRIAEISIPSV
jgi:hypothetical protein